MKPCIPAMARSALVAVAMLGIAYAQAGPEFEVAPAVAGRGPNGMAKFSRTPQRIAFQTARLADIVAFAYDLPQDRIERRPQWMYDNLYNVAVTTADPAGLPEQKLMLQKLLEERFGLVVHRVSNASPVYFLVAGPRVKLTTAKEGDSADVPEFRTVAEADTSGHPGLSCLSRHASMNDLAAWLYPRLQLPVLDKTGITGFFDIEIHGLPLRGGAEGTIEAVRDSLGLNLEVHRGTAETLIIDHVEKPKDN